jgi:hypothetical protein
VCSRSSAGKADISKVGQASSGTDEKAETMSLDGHDENYDDDESEIDDGTGWSEMDRYNIYLEDWMRHNQESKSVVKLPMPTTEPPAKKDKVNFFIFKFIAHYLRKSFTNTGILCDPG